MKKSSIIAAFDFDNTLTSRDSLLPFLIYASGYLTAAKHLLLELPGLIQYCCGTLERQKIKERVLTRFFKGMSQAQLQSLGENYAATFLPTLVKAEGLKRLQWHLDQQHRCILVSANLELYLKPWALAAGFSDVLASQLQMDDRDIFTGKLKGKNCWGEEKVRRLEKLLGSKEHYTLYAYGDSRGDKELLELADFPAYRSWEPSKS